MELTDVGSVRMSLINATNEEGVTCQRHLFATLVAGRTHLSVFQIS